MKAHKDIQERTRVTFTLPKELAEQLSKRAQAERRSMSAVVGLALEERFYRLDEVELPDAA